MARRTTPADDALPDAPPVIRVAIVAESPVVRAGLDAVLAGEADVRIEAAVLGVEHFAGLSAASALASHDEIDVLIWAPRASLLRDAVRRYDDADLDGQVTRTPTVVLLEHMDVDVCRDAYAGGAGAVLPLDVPTAELIAALRAVASGLVVMQPLVASELATPTHIGRRRVDTPVSLTPREQEVLTLLARGLANKAMASQLGITEHTVKTHVAAIYDKLEAGNRAEAVVAAARHGLIML